MGPQRHTKFNAHTQTVTPLFLDWQHLDLWVLTTVEPCYLTYTQSEVRSCGDGANVTIVIGRPYQLNGRANASIKSQRSNYDAIKLLKKLHHAYSWRSMFRFVLSGRSVALCCLLTLVKAVNSICSAMTDDSNE